MRTWASASDPIRKRTRTARPSTSRCPNGPSRPPRTAGAATARSGPGSAGCPTPRRTSPRSSSNSSPAVARDALRDYEQKRDEYLAAGVREYWIIDRFRRIMTVYRKGAARARPRSSPKAETYQTDLLPGFVLPLARLLGRADLWKKPAPSDPASPPPEGPMVKIRRAYEGLFLGLFLFFLLITDLRYLKGWPVSLFLEATPLVAVTTALTTHTIYRNLVWGLVVIAVTMMLGRVWCNWMCPFGILHHIFGYIGNTPEHQAAHRGQPLQEDLRDQVLHPRRDARDGEPLGRPDGARRPFQN